MHNWTWNAHAFNAQLCVYHYRVSFGCFLVSYQSLGVFSFQKKGGEVLSLYMMLPGVSLHSFSFVSYFNGMKTHSLLIKKNLCLFNLCFCFMEGHDWHGSGRIATRSRYSYMSCSDSTIFP